MTHNDGAPVKAAATSARIIDALIELDGATITELDNHIDLSKSSIHNHLTTLEQLGLIVRNEWTYRVSLRFLEIGNTARNRHPFYQTGLSEVRQLATASRLSASLVVVERNEAICLHTETGKKTNETAIEAGDTLPFHCTAPGKALLAEMSPENVDVIIDSQGQQEFTANTLTDRNALDEELQAIRSKGLAFNREEWQANLRGVAVAVSDRTDSPFGAICVASTTDAMSGKRFQQDIPGQVISSGNRIRKSLHSP